GHPSSRGPAIPRLQMSSHTSCDKPASCRVTRIELSATTVLIRRCGECGISDLRTKAPGGTRVVLIAYNCSRRARVLLVRCTIRLCDADRMWHSRSHKQLITKVLEQEVEAMSDQSDMKGRGYILAATISFLRETAGSKHAEEILQTVSPELQEVCRRVQPAELYPIPMFAELNGALVRHLAGNDEAKARDILIKCGRHMGREASNT